jgi:predicted transcriptional regulator
MKKKETTPITRKPAVVKSLKFKLIAAVHKVLKDNKSELTDKIQKVVDKSIKRIVKKTDKKIKKAIELA